MILASLNAVGPQFPVNRVPVVCAFPKIGVGESQGQRAARSKLNSHSRTFIVVYWWELADPTTQLYCLIHDCNEASLAH